MAQVGLQPSEAVKQPMSTDMGNSLEWDATPWPTNRSFCIRSHSTASSPCRHYSGELPQKIYYRQLQSKVFTCKPP